MPSGGSDAEVLCQPPLTEKVKGQTETIPFHPLHLCDVVPHRVVFFTAALGPSFRITLSAHEILVSTNEIFPALCLGTRINMLGGIGTALSLIVPHRTSQSRSQRSHCIGDFLISKHLSLAL